MALVIEFNEVMLRDEIDKEIDYLAHEIVVPITGEPTTQYEFDAIKKYKAELGLFANHIVTLIKQQQRQAQNPKQ